MTASVQLTSPRTPNDTMPNSAVMQIAASEVAVACPGAKPASKTSNGTITMPPPTPKSALKKPAATPIPARTEAERLACGTAVFCLR